MLRFQTVGGGSAQKGQEIGHQSEQRNPPKIRNKTNRTNRTGKFLLSYRVPMNRYRLSYLSY